MAGMSQPRSIRTNLRAGAGLLLALLLLALSGRAGRAATAQNLPLQPGCTSVPSAYPDGTPSEAIVAAINPSAAVTALWQFDTTTKAFQAEYFRPSGANAPPIDSARITGGAPLIVCLDVPALLTSASTSAAALTVQVEFVLSGGAAPPPGATPRVIHRPAPGLEVRIVPAGDATVTPVASGVTDDTGSVSLQLAAGSYWVFVPLPAANPGAFGQPPLLVTMPDGTRVLQWTLVDLPSGARQSVSLAIPLPLA